MDIVLRMRWQMLSQSDYDALNVINTCVEVKEQKKKNINK